MDNAHDGGTIYQQQPRSLCQVPSQFAQQHHQNLPRDRVLQDRSWSLFGTTDMPSPRPAAKPKSRFTPEDNKLTVKLKRKYDLTWKQIANFFYQADLLILPLLSSYHRAGSIGPRYFQTSFI